MLDRGELDELALVQLGDLVDAALLDKVGGVERPGGTLVVEGGGGVDRVAVEEEIELGLAGRPCPVVGEAVDDVFEDEAVVGDEEVGDGAGGGGEIASEVVDDGVGGVGAAVLEVGDGFGVGGDEPEGAEGGGFGGCGGA